MRLSVVIAAYNAEQTLGDQLDALAAQDAPFTWEVIVSDNGSSDGTRRVAESYAARLPHLTVLDSSATRGPGAARNVGAQAARGAGLAFCDADDVVAPGWVAAMDEALQGQTLVTGTSRRAELGTQRNEHRLFEWSRYVAPFFPQLPGAGAGNLGVDAGLFESLGGFDTRLRTGEDVDLCWRAQLAGHHLGHAPAAMVDVTNRAGLRATFRQHFAYGSGNRLLIVKFADVIAAYADLPHWQPPATSAHGSSGSPPETDAAPSLAARVVRKLRRTRHLSELEHVASRAGYAAGRRWGTTDTTIEPLPVPPAGPLVP